MPFDVVDGKDHVIGDDVVDCGLRREVTGEHGDGDEVQGGEVSCRGCSRWSGDQCGISYVGGQGPGKKGGWLVPVHFWRE